MRANFGFHFLSVFLISNGVARGQCNEQFSLGADTTLCAGSTIVLSAGAGYQSYLWSTGSTSPSITVSAANTYSCTATAFGTSGELVVNGNFSQGATGFTSDYVPGYGGTYGLLSGSGTYATSSSPSFVHNNFYFFNDHTGGGGNMLVVNGAEVAGQNIWCQTLTVAPNTNYAFSAWLATAFPESPAEMVFTINGNIIGTPLNAPFATGQWLNFYSIWNSGANTSITICISNQNSANSGNDFALDDISFAPFCTYTDAVVISVQDYPQPDLGPDVEVCEGVPVVLNATWPGADAYSWQNGAGGPTLQATSSGMYWVDVTENTCTERDSVLITFSPLPQVDLGADREQCAGDLVQLDASVPGATYTWQDGSTMPTYQVSGSELVSVTVDLNGCTASDEVNFQYFPIPVVDLGPDTSICADTVLQVSVARPGGSYIWEDGSTGAARTLQQSGLYHVTVTVNGCSGSDSLDLGTIPLPYVDLGPDFLLCEGRTAVLDATGAGLTYLWSTGDTTAELTITEEGVYLITVGNPCGTLEDSVKVEQDRCDCPVFVPNAFTPDGDGLNEFFRPQFDCDIDRYVFRVFDRWGLEVWSSEDRREAWDGEGTPNGIYAWALVIRPITVNDRTLRKLFGHVVLIR